MSGDWVDSNRMRDGLHDTHVISKRQPSKAKKRTPAFPPKYDPTQLRGAEIPNHKITTKSIVPKGTAPDEPAMIRKKLSKKTTANITVGRAVAVMKALLRRSVPPREAYTRLEMYPLTLKIRTLACGFAVQSLL